MELLDCTLRDGGYYTNWDFASELVENYISCMNRLPVDYLEVGYRSLPMEGYLGEYFYTPVYVLEKLKQNSEKKLVIILNEKDVSPQDAATLLVPIRELVDMVRLAIDPQNFSRALTLAEAVKKIGFKVGFNVMYMSRWKDQNEFLSLLPNVDDLADYFYLVDSYGGVFPNDVRSTIKMVREKTQCKLGFHGHNNLEMGLINTLTAIEEGASIVDATITGMGRGAGNCKMELLLATLNAHHGLNIDYNALAAIVESFDNLQEKYRWGTNLPYMVSGANSLPQKEVMEWVSKRYFSFNSIIRALANNAMDQLDNKRYEIFSPNIKYDEVLIIGGGHSAIDHKEAILRFLDINHHICVIHASSKNAIAFREVKNKQFYCLVGNEGIRLEKVYANYNQFEGDCILPPYPRKMGTYVPELLEANTYELSSIQFTELVKDAHTVIALQAAMDLNAKRAYLCGYDGYRGSSIVEKDQELFIENTKLFEEIANHLKCISITPTKYDNLDLHSVYKLIDES